MKLLLVTLAFLAVAPTASATGRAIELGGFWDSLWVLCAGTYGHKGRIVVGSESNAAYAGKALSAGPAACSERQIRLTLNVSGWAPETLVITRNSPEEFVLEHHRGRPGGVAPITEFRGSVTNEGSTRRQIFRSGLPEEEEERTLEITANRMLIYEQRRGARHIGIAFDLSSGLY